MNSAILLPIRKNDKWGFIDSEGNILIKPQFDDVYGIDKKIYPTALVISSYKAPYRFFEDMAAVKIKDKWGFINKSGDIVVEPKFDKPSCFGGDIAIVELDGKLLIIKKEGEKVRELGKAKYPGHVYTAFNEEVCAIGINDKWGFIDKSGDVIIEPQFEECKIFSEGFAAVKIKDKWGYVDKSGNVIIEPLYDFGGHFSERLALVSIKRINGFIDKKGDRVVKLKYAFAGHFKEGLAYIATEHRRDEINWFGGWGYINNKGETMISNSAFCWVYPFKEGLAKVEIEINDKSTFINKLGEFIAEPKYDFCHWFSEGFAAVSINNKWGFIDKTSEIIIDCRFDGAQSFYDGIASVKIQGKNGCMKDGYIDTHGDYIWEPSK